MQPPSLEGLTPQQRVAVNIAYYRALRLERRAAERLERRASAIAMAIPLAAPLVAKADKAVSEESAAYFTERAYEVLARHGLDFAADVIEAIGAHLAAAGDAG